MMTASAMVEPVTEDVESVGGDRRWVWLGGLGVLWARSSDGDNKPTITFDGRTARFTGTSVIRFDTDTTGAFGLTNDGGEWNGDFTFDGTTVIGVGTGSGDYEGLQYRYEGEPPNFTWTIEPIGSSRPSMPQKSYSTT